MNCTNKGMVDVITKMKKAMGLTFLKRVEATTNMAKDKDEGLELNDTINQCVASSFRIHLFKKILEVTTPY